MSNRINGWPDSDTRHVFEQTAATTHICHKCGKHESDPQHVAREFYDRLKTSYARIAA